MYTTISFLIIGSFAAFGIFALILVCTRQVQHDVWELKSMKQCQQQHHCNCRHPYQCPFMPQAQYNPFWDGSDDDLY